MCGVGKELSEESLETAYTYTDRWLDAAEEIDLPSYLHNKKLPVKILIGNINNSSVYSVYSNETDILNRSPKTIIVNNGEALDLEKNRSFLVYSANNLNTPVALEVEDGPEKNLLVIK